MAPRKAYIRTEFQSEISGAGSNSVEFEGQFGDCLYCPSVMSDWHSGAWLIEILT